MHLNFRQGLISFQQSGALPQYLSASSTVGYIDINVTPTPLIATIAHGSSDYLLKFDVSVHAAWGPIVSGTDSYLYLELNVITGALTYGITTHEPVISMVEPSAPFAGQMWFDLNPGVTVFKARNADNTKWVPSPRLVLAVVLNGNVNQIQMYTAGTSGALNVPGRPGYLMLDSQLRPLRTSTGELLTQDTGVRLKSTVGTSGVLSAPVNSYVPVRANEPIPPMSLVYLSGIDSVSLASSDPALVTPKNPIGIVETALALNETGVITQAGELMYDQWDWSADIGKPLYSGFNGELTTVRPQSVQAYRVGYVKSAKSILFYVDSETTPQVVSVAGSIISGVPPIVTTTNVNGIGEIVSSISIHAADATHDGYMTSGQALVLDGFDARLTADETLITGLQSSKSNVGHTHVIADTTGLQTTLTNIETAIGLKVDKIIPSANGNLAALNSAGAVIDSLYQPSAFALSAHVHLISEVTSLQTILNLKSDVGHFHSINDVTNLQSALDNKAFVNHTHSITSVSGLQTALDGKAFVAHAHVAADVTDFSEAVDDRVSALIIPGANIGIVYNDAANTLTISNTAAASVLNFYEGSTLRSTYPNSVPSSVVFGSGLTATVSGTNSEVLTVTAPSVHTLDALDDVVITAPTATQVLTYNGTTWVNAAAPSGGGGGGVSLPATEVAIGSGTGLTSSAAVTVTPVDASTLFGGFNIDGALNVNSPYNKVSNIIAGGHIYLGTGATGVDAFGNEIGTSSITLGNSGGGFNVDIATAVGIFNGGSISMNASQAEDGNAGDVIIWAGNINPVNPTAVNKAGSVAVHAGAYETAAGGEGFTTLAWRSGNVEFYCGSKVLMVLKPTGSVTFGASSNGLGSMGAAGQMLMSYGDTSPEWMPIPARPLTMIPFSDAEVGFGYPTIIGSADQHHSHYRCTVTTPITFTVAPDTDFPGTAEWWDKTTVTANAPMPPGGTVLFGKHGAGDVIIAAGPGVTINTPSTLTITKLHGKITLIKVGPNEWDLEGNLAP